MKKKPIEAEAAVQDKAKGDRDEPDALQSFLETQSKKCAAHHRTHTSEVLELIRKHRKT